MRKTVTLERAARLGPRVEMQQLTFRREGGFSLPRPAGGSWGAATASSGLSPATARQAPPALPGSTATRRGHRHPVFRSAGGRLDRGRPGVCVPTRPGGSQPRRCPRAARGVAGAGLSPPSLRDGDSADAAHLFTCGPRSRTLPQRECSGELAYFVQDGLRRAK